MQDYLLCFPCKEYAMHRVKAQSCEIICSARELPWSRGLAGVRDVGRDMARSEPGGYRPSRIYTLILSCILVHPSQSSGNCLFGHLFVSLFLILVFIATSFLKLYELLNLNLKYKTLIIQTVYKIKGQNCSLYLHT